jgi:hypothetical protein
MVKVKEDLTGHRFGRLVVLEQADDYVEPKSGYHKARWMCQCDCGSDPIIVLQSNLRDKTKGTKSCGCINIEFGSELGSRGYRHKINKYDLSGEYGIGWTTNTNKEFYFDLEDYDKIKDYCWSENVNTKGYHSLVAYDRNLKKSVTMFHIIVGKQHDHINRNSFDNRKENLRPATVQENNYNKSQSKRNTSGFIGVYFDKKYKTWYSSIKISDKTTRLGTFQNKTDAIRARFEAEAKYYGDFAPQRHLFEEYEILI